MLYITSSNYLKAAKEAFLNVLESNREASDPDIDKEDAAVIEITNVESIDMAAGYDGKKMYYNFDLIKYYPSNPIIIEEEMAHWNTELIKGKKIRKLIDHLKKNPNSRRAILDLWDNKYAKYLNKPAVCVSQLYFRIIDGKLDMHSHARANDAYKLLLMDMQVMMTIQTIVADELDIKAGNFIHFIDSLQLYKKDRSNIMSQKEFIVNSEIWRV